MKKITITNAYTYHNKGDAGILLGIISVLKTIYKNEIEVNILTFTPELDKEKYKNEICIKEIESNLLNPRPYNHNRLGKYFAIFKLFIRMIYLKINFFINKKRLLKKEKTLSLLNESDLIIVCGGGFLGGNKKHSIMHLLQIDFDTKFNKKVIMMGTSIEPFENKYLQYYTERILKKVDYILARENVTHDYLRKFIDKDKCYLVPDMAFMLENQTMKFEIIEQFKLNYKYIVGITLRDWNFPESNNVEESMNEYIKVIVNVMVKYIKDNIGFVFIPQVIVSHANDIDVAIRVRELLPKNLRDSFLIIEDDLAPLELKALIGNMNYFIGTRMHSNIFALSMLVPTLAIAYEKKTYGIMELIGQKNYVVDINDIKEDEVFSKFDELIKNEKKIKKELEYNLNNIRKEVYKKVKKVLK